MDSPEARNTAARVAGELGERRVRVGGPVALARRGARRIGAQRAAAVAIVAATLALALVEAALAASLAAVLILEALARRPSALVLARRSRLRPFRRRRSLAAPSAIGVAVAARTAVARTFAGAGGRFSGPR